MINAFPKGEGRPCPPFAKPCIFVAPFFAAPRSFLAPLFAASRSFAAPFFLAALFFSTLSVKAQNFPGYSTGNYTGVNGVFANPANIADGRYRWDVNLFSLGMLVGNNNASFGLKDLGSSFNGDSLRNKLTGKGAGYTSAVVNMEVRGPSFMFNLGKKTAMAFTSRARVMVNMKNIDGQLVDQFLNTNTNSSLPYSFSTPSDNIINVNAWSEFGVSLARVLVDVGPVYLKGGLTLKYLAGFTNGYLQLDGVKGTLNQDVTGVYLSQTTGLLGLGFGGTRIDDIQSGKLGSFNGSGLGADLGFVYEFRPQKHEYKLRIGAALLDIGSISYNKDTSRSGSYSATITGAKKAYVDNFGKLDNFKQYFEANPQFFAPAAGNSQSSYSVSLPTTLQLDLDHFIRGFYLNMAAQFALASTSDAKPYNSSYYNAVTLTPRYEGRRFGAYIPIGYNGLTHFNAGYCIRFGPMFFGSGSMLTALFSNSKQFDSFFGIRFGGLRK